MYVEKDSWYSIRTYIENNGTYSAKIRKFTNGSFRNVETFVPEVDQETGLLIIEGVYCDWKPIQEMGISLQPFWKYSNEDFWNWQPCCLIECGTGDIRITAADL
jgi:hypothetical protein